jgi:PAS domain S-box-containing protein
MALASVADATPVGAARLSDAAFRTLFEQHPDALLLVDPFADAFLAANRRAGELLRWPPDQLIAMRPSRLHAGERGALVVFTQEVLETGEAWARGLGCQGGDGTRILVEYRARRLDLQGRACVLIAARDLATQRQREARSDADDYVRSGLSEWRRVERLFASIETENRLILRAAGEGIYGVDAAGITTFVNPAAEQMLGWRADELVGRGMHQTVHHSHADGGRYPDAHCPIYAAFREGAVQRRDDEVFWRKDGTCFPVEYTSTPILDRGNLVGAVVVFRDISDRREAEQRLQSALAELSALKRRLELENDYLQEEFREASNYHQIVGDSRAVREVLYKVELVAPTDAPVLITGESGTGKELIARAIHTASQRGDRPLIRVNCAAVPKDLFESEFFGHARGAFTGAVAERVGRFELADGGTLFLDEVGEIPLELQSKLLRVLQEGEFERVGEGRTRRVDLRIVAATNRRLEEEAEAGRFRADLFYRLNVFPIESVPLRQRPEDIPLLAAHFLTKAARRFGRQGLRLSRADVAAMQDYGWPGNVRELENLIERAVIVSTGERLIIDLPGRRPERTPFAPALSPGAEGETPPEMVIDTGTEHAWDPSGTGADGLDRGGLGPQVPRNEQERVALERRMIEQALAASGGKVFGPGGAAERLGLKPTTLASRIKRHGIQVRL